MSSSFTTQRAQARPAHLRGAVAGGDRVYYQSRKAAFFIPNAELNSETFVSYPEGISLIEADAAHRLIRLYLFVRNLWPWYKKYVSEVNYGIFTSPSGYIK